MRILILMSLMTSAIWQQHSTQADTEIDRIMALQIPILLLLHPQLIISTLHKLQTLTLQIRKLPQKVL